MLVSGFIIIIASIQLEHISQMDTARVITANDCKLYGSFDCSFHITFQQTRKCTHNITLLARSFCYFPEALNLLVYTRKTVNILAHCNILC